MIIHNTKTSPRFCRTDDNPCMTINQQGCYLFNIELIKLMSLKVGDTVNVAQKEKDSPYWFFFKGSDGFPLRKYKKDCGMLCFNNRHSALLFLKSKGVKSFSCKLHIKKSTRKYPPHQLFEIEEMTVRNKPYTPPKRK